MGAWAGFDLSRALVPVLAFLGTGAVIVVALTVYRLAKDALYGVAEGEWEDENQEAWERRNEFWAAMYANEDRELPDGHFSWSSWD